MIGGSSHNISKQNPDGGEQEFGKAPVNKSTLDPKIQLLILITMK